MAQRSHYQRDSNSVFKATSRSRWVKWLLAQVLVQTASSIEETMSIMSFNISV